MTVSKKILRLQQKVKLAERELAKAIGDEQRNCKHADIADIPGSPPWRICCQCGMTEVGWGCGHVVLKGAADLPRLGNEDYFRAHRRGLTLHGGNKGPLLRKETTVSKQIDLWVEGELG